MYQGQWYFQVAENVKQVTAASWDKRESDSDGQGLKPVVGLGKVR